jgi:predicted RNase H-like HicB family nuclease
VQVRVHARPKAGGGFEADIPSLPGCSAEGGTWEELLRNAQAAITAWLGRDLGPLETSPEEPLTAWLELSPTEIRKLPRERKDAIFEAAAAAAEHEYRTNPELTDFEAFGEEDLYDEYPDALPG